MPCTCTRAMCAYKSVCVWKIWARVKFTCSHFLMQWNNKIGQYWTDAMTNIELVLMSRINDICIRMTF